MTHVAERNLAAAVVIASGLEANVLRAVESIGESHGLHVLAALEKPLTARRLGEVLSQYARLNPERVEPSGVLALDADELQRALRRGQLRPLFEPRIDLTTGVVSSVEAGGRWRGADGAPVPSAAFFPTLGRDGALLAFIERLVAESCGVRGRGRARRARRSRPHAGGAEPVAGSVRRHGARRAPERHGAAWDWRSADGWLN